MTLAQELTQAVLAAQTRIQEAVSQAEAEISARTRELQQLEALPTDAQALEVRLRDLQNEHARLAAEVIEFTAHRTQLEAVWQQKLEQTWQQLQALYRAREKELQRARLRRAYQAALVSFKVELQQARLNPEHATPAQLLNQLGRLRAEAERIKAQCAASLHAAAQAVTQQAALSEQHSRWQSQQAQLEEQKQQLRARLQMHGLTEKDQFIADVCQAEEGALKQLRRDVLEPLLTEAREERQCGLAGEDPLWQLQTLQKSA